MIRVAINGFGRIGRVALRQISKLEDMEVVAINDLSEAKQLAYLYKYDSIHRTLEESVGSTDSTIVVNNKAIKIFNEKDPNLLPWRELNIDVVLECTGAFTSKESATSHINAGAKKVVISAPSKDECKTIVYGVNENTINAIDTIISAASCTTNCLAPILKVLNDNFTVNYGFMSTIHAMTNDQETLDIAHKKGIESRRGRAASLNIIPTSTGAASAIGKVIPSLEGKLGGTSYRVPVQDGSLVDLTVVVNKTVTKEEVNNAFRNSVNNTLKIVNIPLVSCDIIGTTAGAIVDASLTDVITNNENTIIKVAAWYDNEWGYTAQMIRTARRMFEV